MIKKTIGIIILTSAIIVIIMDSLQYPLSSTDKKILKDVVSEQLPALIAPVLWNNVFHYQTFFDGFNQGLITCNAGSGSSCPSSGPNPTGLVLSTESANSGQFAHAYKTPLSGSGLSWTQPARMSVSIKFTTLPQKQTAYFIRGSYSSIVGPYYGFKVVDNQLYGVVYDNNTQKSEQTVLLGTVNQNITYNLEMDFDGSGNFAFYINGLLVNQKISGVKLNIQSLLSGYDTGFYEFYILTNENAGKTVIVSSFEYIQAK